MAAINCDRRAAERIEGAGLDQRFDGRPVDCARIDPLAEVEQAAETVRRPVRPSTMAAAAAPPQPLMADRPKQILPSITVKSASERFTSGGSTVMSIRRQSSRCSTSESFFLKLRPGDVAREQGGHELDRIMGLEIGRHVGDQGVGGRMALVEAVAGELFDHAEQFVGLASSTGPWRCAPSMNSSRNLAIIGSFFLLIALMQV